MKVSADVRVPIPDRWRIWSFEHSAWWRPNELGYTERASESGVYSLARALEIVTCAAPGDEAMLPAPEQPTMARPVEEW